MSARAIAPALLCVILLATPGCSSAPSGPAQRIFASPEEAVAALAASIDAEDMEQLSALFGPDSQELVDTSDPVIARRNRETFTAAYIERWQLLDSGPSAKTLVIGNEEWPFPVPLVQERDRWRFDTAAGKEEVLARRIGRNELAVIRICRTYVAAQRHYAATGHDGKRAGLYATRFASDPGKHNGLFWPVTRGEARSPLGDLVAQAADEGRELGSNRPQAAPFHGYYFKILTGQGGAAAGGAKSYIVNGEMSEGFGLIAWPAHYDLTGIMTFMVNHNGIIYEKNLGPATDAASAITQFDPDSSWRAVE